MFKMLLRTCCVAINRLVYCTGLSASLLMPFLALTVAFEVFSRYVLNAPTIWAYDVSLFLFGYIAALTGALAQQKRSHIIVDVLYLAVPDRIKALFNLLTYSLAVFFLSVIFYMSLGKFEEAMEFDYRRQSEWAPSMAHFWVMMMVACTMFVLQFVSDMLQSSYFLFTGQRLMPETDGSSSENEKVTNNESAIKNGNVSTGNEVKGENA
ncbi:TRAP transporter small permease [Endozoicomonas sp. OPT23]|uniref:TRAP transporter small permease subunit n=1 Tax=Endozoicomonas sp. OPT23 TaxID=2072845 RepID=UPI00129BBAE2|nr:TRAP transporter small permease [Endozoicomonas sp. OPT23]MRI34837.1 TRAP transporter small permease [Endozoicomonas sp. OPT23]